MYLISILCLTVPIIICYAYSKIEYGYSLGDKFQKWRLAKFLGILVYLCLAYVLLQPDNLGRFFNRFWFFLIEPGVSLGLFVFSRPASELIEGFSDFFSFGEDFGFVLGWIGLLLVCAWTFVDVLGRS